MKRIIAFFSAVVLLVIAFSGCAPQDEGNTPTSTVQADAAPAVTPMPDITEKTDYVTEKWVASEIEFTASTRVRNIIKSELDVTFTNRSTGTTITMPGFWDGDKIWKVRFAPTEYGIWDYETKTTGDDIGINGIKGTLACNEYKGDLAIYKHGFIKTEPDTKYFMYADGTPFFYLGDTHWTMPKEEYDSAGDNAGDIETNSHFRYIVDRRAAQGFTVYQSEPLEGGIKVSDGNVLEADIAAFQNLDRYFQYIAEKGLVHANAKFFLPGTGNITAQFVENLRPLTRYWIARYGAYPVMWTLGQECDDASNFSSEVPLWSTYIQMCLIVDEVDPYDHPMSAHQINARDVTAKGGIKTRPIDWGTATDKYGTGYTITSRRSKFYGVKGHTWWASQWRPLVRTQYNFNIPRDYWENGEGKPAVDYEASYHYLGTGDFGARAQAYIAYLSGMCGHGYGAADMWYYIGNYQMDTESGDGIDTITPEMKQSAKWSDFIDAPISNELTYLRGFFENIGWWKLVPDFDDGNAFKKMKNKEGFYAAAYDGNDVYVVYLYNRTVDSAGKLVNMDKKATYVAQWFDTRTGQYTLIDNTLKADANGEYDIPQKPVADDMILLVTKK